MERRNHHDIARLVEYSYGALERSLAGGDSRKSLLDEGLGRVGEFERVLGAN